MKFVGFELIDWEDFVKMLIWIFCVVDVMCINYEILLVFRLCKYNVG